MHRTINTSKGRLTIQTGSEGPSHDPYAFTEISLSTPTGEVTYHGGLGEWVSFQDAVLHTEDAALLFQKMTGHSPQQWEDYFHQARSRCRKCGCKKSHYEQGYPGESFIVCNKCDNIISTDFCESAIV